MQQKLRNQTQVGLMQSDGMWTRSYCVQTSLKINASIEIQVQALNGGREIPFVRLWAGHT